MFYVGLFCNQEGQSEGISYVSVCYWCILLCVSYEIQTITDITMTKTTTTTYDIIYYNTLSNKCHYFYSHI